MPLYEESIFWAAICDECGFRVPVRLEGTMAWVLRWLWDHGWTRTVNPSRGERWYGTSCVWAGKHEGSPAGAPQAPVEEPRGV